MPHIRRRTTSARLAVAAAIVGALVLAGCGTEQPVIRDPDLPDDGQELFEMLALVDRPGCVTCHSVEEGQDGVGPSLFGIGTAAASRVEGYDAERYLRQSIVDPEAYVVDGYRGGIMPDGLVTILTDEQIAALVDYMEGL